MTGKAPLGYQSQVTEMCLLCCTKKEGDLAAALLIFTEVFFLNAGKNREGDKLGKGMGTLPKCI